MSEEIKRYLDLLIGVGEQRNHHINKKDNSHD